VQVRILEQVRILQASFVLRFKNSFEIGGQAATWLQKPPRTAPAHRNAKGHDF
jgi:hypothetical protein